MIWLVLRIKDYKILWPCHGEGKEKIAFKRADIQSAMQTHLLTNTIIILTSNSLLKKMTLFHLLSHKKACKLFDNLYLLSSVINTYNLLSIDFKILILFSIMLKTFMKENKISLAKLTEAQQIIPPSSTVTREYYEVDWKQPIS